MRLIRVRGRRRAKEARRQVDIWLLTDVGAERLSVAQAAAFYRLRWENEGLFRTYKRTLGEVHLVGHTVRAVHREAYGSLLSCQLPLAQGAWELRQRRGPRATAVEPYGARQAIVVIRQELIAAMKPDRRVSYRERLGSCARERRERTSRKEKRESPRRMPHVPPKPPRLLTMNEKEKALFSRLDAAS